MKTMPTVSATVLEYSEEQLQTSLAVLQLAYAESETHWKAYLTDPRPKKFLLYRMSVCAIGGAYSQIMEDVEAYDELSDAQDKANAS